MNATINLLKNHRSNRNFVKGHKLTTEELASIIEATKQAPSWMNGQQYNVIIVDNQEIKEKLYSLSTRNLHIDTSSVFLIFCADVTRQKLSSDYHNQNFAVENNIDLLINATTDVTIAMQNAATAAESLGYGTVYCGGVRVIAKEIIEMFDISKYSFPICGLSIGKLDEELTTERIKPRFKTEVNVGFNEYIKSTIEDVVEYDKTMEIFAEARETKLWSKKFADVYEVNAGQTQELLKKQGF